LDLTSRIEYPYISDSNVKLIEFIGIVSKLSLFTVSVKSALINELATAYFANLFHLPIGKLGFGVNFFGGYRPGHKRVYYAAHIGLTLNQGESLLRFLITPTIWMMSNLMTPIMSHSVSRLREINKFRVPNSICVPNKINKIEEGISPDRLPSQSLSRR
jgi:hypothetical protein